MTLKCSLVFFMILLGACAPFTPTSSPPVPDLPLTYAEQSVSSLSEKVSVSASVFAPDSRTLSTASTEATHAANGRWWQSLGNAELDRLIHTALSESFDIQAAFARLRQSEATARKSGAALLPTLDMDADTSHQRRSVRTEDTARRETTNDTVSLGLAASYEVDLWGRVASIQEADRLRVRATRDDLESAAMTLAATVADTWVSLVGARAELSVLEQQIAINTMLVDVLALRFANAMSSGLDVLQQQELLASVQAERPALEMEIRTLLNQLAVLMGAVPGASVVPVVVADTLPMLPPLPDPGLPVALLGNRPDIRAAWFRLTAVQWDTSAARADRLPALRLSAGGSFSSSDTSLLFSNWLTTLAAGLTGPLFDGGRRSAEVDRLRAVVEEQVQVYGKTVAISVQEVEDALSNEKRQRERLFRLEEQLRYAEVARQEARISYFGGRDSFLRYITQLQSVQKLERTVVRERARLIRYRVALHRALGGDWTRSM